MSTELRDQLQRTLGGACRLGRELGGGGMSRVFAAEDDLLGRRVVVKVLAPELAAGVNVERFKREIRVATELHHPRIVPVLSAGQSGDILFYTMPFIEGESLRAVLDRERQLPLDAALVLARDIAEALDYAHGHNIVHRDIKPANVLIENGRAVVTDFGIARAIEKAADVDSVTSTGLTLGTPSYMSPEQASAEKQIDGRSDVYSLACVLYEMLAGEPPFTGPNARVIISRHLNDRPPSMRTARPDVPKHVDRAIEKALAKAPAGRFRTAAAFVQALEDPAWTPGALEVARRQRGRWTWAAAAGLTAVIAAGLLAGRALRSASPAVAGFDATRIAVLYFDAPPADTQLVTIGRGIMRDLIASLRTADLTLISEPGVRTFGVDADPRTVARELGVGTIVYGRLESPGRRDSVRVDVRLVDATAVERGSALVYAPRATSLALRDAVVRQVAEKLRARLGRDVQLKRWKAGTASERAWVLRHGARNLVDYARDANLTGAEGQARTAYEAADSLLALAARADAAWPEAFIARGWVAFDRSRLAGADREARRRLLDSGLVLAGRALALRTENPSALELRGHLRFERWQHGLAGASTAARDSAEADLRAATGADPSLARAWNAYSALLQAKGDRRGAVDAARRAIAADAYLREVIPAMNRLIIAELGAERNDTARTLCEEGLRRFPRDPLMRQCRLNVLGYAGAGHLDIRRAWAALEVEEREGLYSRVGGIWPPGRFFVAAVLARSGLADSARAVAAATRYVLRGAGQGSANQIHEAYVWTILGQRDTALALLERAVRSQPTERTAIAQLPWFRALRSDPRFARIAGGG